MDGGGEAATRRMVVGSCTAGNKSIINPIMMRFRPIAPKPVTGGSISSGGASSVESNKNSSISKGRTKRKYVRVRRYNRKKKSTIVVDDHDHQTAITTLQLLPVEFIDNGGRRLENKTDSEKEMVLVSDPKGGSAVIELWVTVECVTEEDTCMDLRLKEGEIGYTDEERIKNLEEDTCPGFVSDGMNRVEWLNKAFKKMVWQRKKKNEVESETEVGVWLISKPKLPNLRRVFTCQIKLQFKRGTEMEKDSKLVPCDAWRMDGGGFAWKLDVKAALTLAPLLQEDHFY